MNGTQAVLCYKRRISAANLNEASSKTSVFPLSGCVSGFLFLRWSFNFPFFIHAKTVNCVWKCPDPVTSLSDIFAGFTCWSVLILADGNNFQQQRVQPVHLEKNEKLLFFAHFPVGTYLNCTARNVMTFRRPSHMGVQCFYHAKDKHSFGVLPYRMHWGASYYMALSWLREILLM